MLCGQLHFLMSGRTAGGAMGSAFCDFSIPSGPSVGGTYLEINAMNSEISSYLTILTSAVEHLQSLTVDGVNSSVGELCEPIFDGLSRSIGILKRGFEVREGGKSRVTNQPTTIVFASMFSRFVQNVLNFLENYVFSANAIVPYVTTFAHLHLFYVNMVLNPDRKGDLKKFREIWSRVFLVWSDIGSLTEEVDFLLFIPKLDEIAGAVMQHLGRERGTEFQNNVNVCLVDLKQKLEMAQAHVTDTILKNVLIDLRWFGDKTTSYIEMLKDAQIAQQIRGKMVVVTKLTLCLDMCLAVLSLRDVLCELDQLIRSDRFDLDPTSFQTCGYQWRTVTQILSLASVEAKTLITCISTRGGNPMAAKTLAGVSRHLAVAMGKYEDVNASVLRDRLVPLTESGCVIEKEYEEQTLAYLKGRLEEWTEEIRDKSHVEMLSIALNEMELPFLLKTTNGTLNGLSQRLIAVVKFESILNECVAISEEEAVGFRKLKAYLSGNLLKLKLQHACKIVISAVSNLEGGASQQRFRDKNYQLALAFENLSLMVGSAISSKIYAREAGVFIEFFSRFVEVCGVVMSKNGNGEYNEVLAYALSSFPQLDMMNRALPVASVLTDIRATIENIRARSVATTDAVMSLVESKHEKPSNERICKAFTESETMHAQILYVLRRVEHVRVATRFLQFYDKFLKSFGKEPEVPLKYRCDSSISAGIATCFPRFSVCLMSFLKSGIIKPPSPSFFKRWLEFMRSVILNENLDRTTAFMKLLESIPLLDMSSILKDAIFNLKLIGSKVYYFEKCHKDKDCSKLIEAFSDMQQTFIHMFVAGSPGLRGAALGRKSQQFLKKVMDVSEDLYLEVQRLWPAIARMLVQVATLVNFDEITRILRADLNLEPDDRTFFSCFFANFVFCTVSAMTSVRVGDLLPDVADNIKRFQEAVNRVLANHTFMLVQNQDAWYPCLERTQEIVKQYWRPDFVENLGERARTYFMRLMALATNSEIRDVDAGIKKLMKVNELLSALEDTHDIDRFTILAEIKSVFDNIELSKDIEDDVKKFMTIIDFGLMTFFVLSLLAINDMFISQFHVTKSLNYVLPVADVRKPHRFPSPIYKIPSVIDSLEQQLSALESAGESPHSMMEQLRTAVREMTDDITNYVRRARPEAGEKLKALIQDHHHLMRVLELKKKQQKEARSAWVDGEHARLAAVARDKQELDRLRCENRRRNTELSTLVQTITWRQQANTTLEQQLAEYDRALACESGVAPCRTRRERAADNYVDELKELGQKLSEVTSEHSNLKAKLEVLHWKLGITKKRRPSKRKVVPAARAPYIHVNTDDIEEPLLNALARYKSTTWTDAEPYKTNAALVMQEIERAMARFLVQHFNNVAVRAELDSKRGSLVTTRSALLKLLED